MVQKEPFLWISRKRALLGLKSYPNPDQVRIIASITISACVLNRRESKTRLSLLVQVRQTEESVIEAFGLHTPNRPLVVPRGANATDGKRCWESGMVQNGLLAKSRRAAQCVVGSSSKGSVMGGNAARTGAE